MADPVTAGASAGGASTAGAAIAGLAGGAVPDLAHQTARQVAVHGYPDPAHDARTAGELPRVLMLHGVASGSSAWDGVRARLSGTARLWSADLPWRGEGVGDWAYQPDATVWLDRALDEMGPVDVVAAHSFTATLLLDLLTRGPDDGAVRRLGLSALVLISPFYRPRPRDFAPDTISKVTAASVTIMEEGVKAMAGGRGKPGLHREVAQRLCDSLGAYGWIRFYDLYLRTPFMVLSRVPVPALVITGACDNAAPPAEAEALVRGLPAAELAVVPGCGHHPMLESPEAVAGLMRAFLSRFGAVPHTLERER